MVRHFPNPYQNSTNINIEQISEKCENFSKRIIEPILTQNLNERIREDCLYVGPMARVSKIKIF